ncbi:MAG TPA: matrixin family metalloprotease, partial [Candidatus Eisenbacteria bacterium]
MTSHRFRFAVAALLAGAAALSIADPASAFVRLTRAADPGPGVVQAHWLDSEMPILSVIDATNNDIPYSTALAAIQAAAKAWEDVNTSYLTANPVDVASGSYLPAALAFDGQNSVLFDRTGVNFVPGSGVIEFVRTFVDVSNGHSLDADMVANDVDFYWSTSSPDLTPAPPGQISVDLLAVVTHEYGHYFSLDHTSVANCTMIPYILDTTDQRTLELDDRAGLSTVYPESASRPGGLSPGAVDFAATTGTISGTCVSGYDGSATFGAHVEAVNLADPTPEASISAISGEMTVRDGQGDWMIHGLPPGAYAVRIVPLDGVHTIASDANVGGVFNGL